MKKMGEKIMNVVKRPIKVVGTRLYENVERFLIPANIDRWEASALAQMDLKMLYRILEEDIAESTDLVDTIKQTVQGQVAFLTEITRAIRSVRGKSLPHLEANQAIKDCEEVFLKKLVNNGLNVNYQSEVSPEEIAAKPSLILATHQGGGMENYIAQAITGIECGIVVKGELMKLPFIKDGLASKKAIPVDRRMLRDPEDRKMEIDRIAKEIVQRLAAGENMLVFFEGTRSQTGEIASTPARKAWARDLLAAVDANWAALQAGFADTAETDKTPAGDFQKLLLVMHTMTTMPDAPEEDVFLTRFRLDAPVGARLLRADGLAVKDSEDLYDQNTMFGKARSALRSMLVEIIMERRKKS